MALVYQKTRAETVCSLGQNVFVLLNDKSRMKGDLHARFREKFEVKVLLLTRLRGGLIAPYSIKKYIFLFMLKYVFKTKCKFCNQFVSFSTTY